MENVLEEIAARAPRLIMVIGRSDSGKTTFVEQLMAHLSAYGRPGVVDSDIGQSHVGPPATVGWGRLGRGVLATSGSKSPAGRPAFPGWEALGVEEFYFTGAVSPAGSLLQLLTGTASMTRRALASCEKVILDTTGLVDGDIGRSLKQQKIDLLRPDLVVGLQHEDELEPLLAPFRQMERPRVMTVAVHESAGIKTVAERTAFRQEQFRAYFRYARVMELPLAQVAVRMVRGPVPPGAQHLAGRLVSLRDHENRDMALGIVEGHDEADGAGDTLLIRSPLTAAEKVICVVVGRMDVALR